MTRNGVYYDFTKSKYKFTTVDTRVTFVFSSDLHLTKFEDQYMSYRRDFNIRSKARYNINFDHRVLPDIILYKRIESRGFLILDEGGKALCQENLILTGEQAMRKS